MEPTDEVLGSPEAGEEAPPPPCTACGKAVTWDEVLCPTCGSGLVAQRLPPRPPSKVPGILYKLVFVVGGLFIAAVLIRWLLQVAEIFE